jgi:hypothetical protein
MLAMHIYMNENKVEFYKNDTLICAYPLPGDGKEGICVGTSLCNVGHKISIVSHTVQ